VKTRKTKEKDETAKSVVRPHKNTGLRGLSKGEKCCDRKHRSIVFVEGRKEVIDSEETEGGAEQRIEKREKEEGRLPSKKKTCWSEGAFRGA